MTPLTSCSVVMALFLGLAVANTLDFSAPLTGYSEDNVTAHFYEWQQLALESVPPSRAVCGDDDGVRYCGHYTVCYDG